MLQTRLAGVSYNNRQHNIKNFGCGNIKTYRLQRDPDNVHDANAIEVLMDTISMGYLPKPVAAQIAPQIDLGKKFYAEFVSLNCCSFNDMVGLTVKIKEVIE
ncbi:MAG: HIRAN domain-containing protein [Desulfamplus sp.]|nr:HIRAN domain-containing protein [Desulfamplus sp.]